MTSNILEWLNLLIRWVHVIAGIAWIGSSFFFMWLDSHLTQPPGAPEGIAGELWMVHSGGFYQVEKKYLKPGEVPPVLHWFKWEAALTWISGLSLLIVVYYLGGGIYLVDSSVSNMSSSMATGLGLGLLAAAWFVYDVLWTSSLGKGKNVAGALSLMMVLGVVYLLSHTLSGRAAFIHVGAMFGTLMAANVWVRILPAQRQMIKATKAGQKADYTLGARAKIRSIHNNYMTFPVIFIMLSNHFPSTYGNKLNWIILMGLILAGAGVRHFMNVRNKVSRLVLALVPVIVVALFILTLPVSTKNATSVTLTGPLAGSAGSGSGAVHGVIRFEGNVPPSQDITLPAGCADAGGGPAHNKSVLVNDGKLQNVFVWVSQGLGHEMYAVPTDEIIVDQRGCDYQPRVFGVRVGQRVTFLNSDSLFHNVRTVAAHNASFNEPFANKGVRMTKIFNTAEVMVNAKCDVHPWMNAYIGVLPHPFFAVSDARGEFTIKNLPAGNYVLEAWHEVYGRLTQNLSVGPSKISQTEFLFRGR